MWEVGAGGVGKKVVFVVSTEVDPGGGGVIKVVDIVEIALVVLREVGAGGVGKVVALVVLSIGASVVFVE